MSWTKQCSMWLNVGASLKQCGAIHCVAHAGGIHLYLYLQHWTSNPSGTDNERTYCLMSLPVSGREMLNLSLKCVCARARAQAGSAAADTLMGLHAESVSAPADYNYRYNRRLICAPPSPRSPPSLPSSLPPSFHLVRSAPSVPKLPPRFISLLSCENFKSPCLGVNGHISRAAK